MDELIIPPETIEFLGIVYSVEDFNILISNLVVNEDFLAVIFDSLESNPMDRVRDSVKYFYEEGVRKKKNRGFAIDQMKELTDEQFQRMFWLNREAFYWLLLRN